MKKFQNFKTYKYKTFNVKMTPYAINKTKNKINIVVNVKKNANSFY